MTHKWSLPTRYLAAIVLFVLLSLLIYLGRVLIAPLVIGALVAYVLQPVVALLSRYLRLPRRWAVALVYLLFLSALATIPVTLTPVVIDQVTKMTRELVRLQRSIEQALAQFELFGVHLVERGLPVDLIDIFAPLLQPQQVFGILQAATANLAWVLVALVTGYYFLLDWEQLLKGFVRLAPRDYRPDLQRLYLQIREVWRAYLRGQVLLMLIVGVSTWVGAVAVGLPGALLIGLLTGLLDIIPSLGPTVAMAIAVLVALFQGSTHLNITNFWFAVVVLGIFLAVQAFENIWLRPRVLSLSLRLHPAVVFVAIIGALATGGILLALVVVPIISTVAIMGRYIYSRILGLEAWAEPLVELSEAELEAGGLLDEETSLQEPN